MIFVKRFFCICCDGNDSFESCPLCDDERVFEQICEEEIECYMADFYSETIQTNEWERKTEEQKRKLLDAELEEYFL